MLAVLRDDISQMPKNWNRRFKHNRDKMKTGDIFELAEVVRNLAIRDFEKGLSTGEKQMFTRAKKILSSELMYALDMDEKEAEEYLDDLLEETNEERAARRSSRRERRRDGDRRSLAAGGLGRAPGRGGPEGAGRAGRPADGRLVPAGARGRRSDRRVVIAAPPVRATLAPIAGEVAPGLPAHVVPGRRQPLGVGRQRARGAPEARTWSLVHDAARPLVDAGAVRPLRERARALGLRRRRRGRAGDRHDQGGRCRRPRDRRPSTAAACGRFRRRRRSGPRPLARALAAGRPRRAPTTTPSSSRRRGRRADRRSPAPEHQGHDPARPADRGAAARAARAVDADRLPHPSAPRRRRTRRRSATSPRRTCAAISSGRGERGIAELGFSEHVYRFREALDVWRHPSGSECAHRRPRRLRRVPARAATARASSGSRSTSIPGREDAAWPP